MQASHSSTKVKAILETAEASREDITRRDVEKLNQRLTDAEIKEVNKLLTLFQLFLVKQASSYARPFSVRYEKRRGFWSRSKSA